MPGILNIFGRNGNDAGPDLTDETFSAAQRSTDATASVVSKLGMGLAVGAAIALAVGLAPIAIAGSAVATGASLAGGVAVVKATELQAARDGEDAAKKGQRDTVDGLIAKGAGKTDESRDAYFDRLAEMFPSEAKRIREQRAQQEAESNEDVTSTETEMNRDERD